VVILANALALTEVARNRSGPPVQTIQLTERELAIDYRGKEDSGIALRLDWNRYQTRQDSWLDRANLERLGFDCAAALRDPLHYRQLPRFAYVVLEYDGEAWAQWIKFLVESKSVQNLDPEQHSRLMAIDAGKTPEPLLSRYSDRLKYLVLPGVVEIHMNNWDPKTGQPGQYRMEPSVSVLTSKIHVPLPMSATLEVLFNQARTTRPRFSVMVSFGRRFEPWVAGINKF